MQNTHHSLIRFFRLTFRLIHVTDIWLEKI